MADPRKIENCRRAYSDFPDARLISITHEKIGSCEEHIAAQQLLAQRREQKQDTQQAHIENRLRELKKPHWSTVPIFWMTLVILILTAVGTIAAVISLFRR